MLCFQSHIFAICFASNFYEELTTKNNFLQDGSTPSTPQTQKGALKEKVVLKKEPVLPLSKIPDPIPARIPRPKIAKYSPAEVQAQSPDEVTCSSFSLSSSSSPHKI